MMDKILSKLKHALLAQNLTKQHFLIGFSGGVDSTALLLLFSKLQQELNIKVRAIHIDHNLNQHAKDWEEHCKLVAKLLNVELVIQQVYLTHHKNLEANARKMRYAAIANNITPQEIFVTAHHITDQMETIFLNLKRGAGLKGLAGMQEFTKNFGLTIYRPLLAFHKDKLTSLVQENHLTWVNDDSNYNTKYDRNFFRQEIIPRLVDRFPSYPKTMLRSSINCAADYALLQELIEPYYATVVDGDSFKFTLMQSWSIALQNKVLSTWLFKTINKQASSTDLAEIHKILHAEPDKEPLLKLDNVLLRRYKDKLFLTKPVQDVTNFTAQLNKNVPLTLPDNLGTLTLHDDLTLLYTMSHPNKEPNTQLTMQLNTATTYTVKFAYSGKVRIHKNAHLKDIKKIYQEKLVPPWERKRIPLIFLDDKLFWAVGYFINYEKA